MYGAEMTSRHESRGESVEEGNRSAEACTVMLWTHFLESPGLLHRNFEKGYRAGENYPDILDLTRGLENKRLTMFEIYSVDEFMRVSRDIQTRKLLFRTYIQHERVCQVTSQPKARYSTERWTDELAVLINTAHPAIRDDLRSKLEQAKADVANGRKFCLRLDFGQGLKKWFGDVCESSRISFYPKSYDTDKVKNLGIYILNCSKPISCFLSKWTIICCLPCWMLSGGCCYYFYRKKTVDDIVNKFDYRVTFEGRGACEQEDTPCCGCGKIYHLPVLNLQGQSGGHGFFIDY